MRHLASIKTISKIIPHPDANLLEVVQIDGWNVVVHKDIHKEGEKVVFFEIDSFLPTRYEFEFLRKSCYVNKSYCGEGYRIKTIRIREEISQGLVMPLNKFAGITEDMNDVTDLLGVTHFEKPICEDAEYKIKGDYPSVYFPKSEQIRCQSLPEMHGWIDIEFDIDEKIEGTSASVFHLKHNDFGICTHGTNLHLDDENIYTGIVGRKKILEKLNGYCIENDLELAFQGELIGPKIKKNIYKLDEIDLKLYNIWDAKKRRFLTYTERKTVFDDLDLSDDCVPYIGRRTLRSIMEEFKKPLIEALLLFSDGKSVLNANQNREGLVFKSVDLHNGKILSFKVISNKYLLKQKD